MNDGARGSLEAIAVLSLAGLLGSGAAAQGAACYPEGPLLKSSSPDPIDEFGRAVAVDGDWMAVGAPFDDGPEFNEGRVYLFQRGLTGWSPAGTLAGSLLDADDTFGASLDLDGSTLVVGAPDSTGAWPTYEPGSVYVFERSGTSWSEVFSWGPGGSDISRFGTSVAIDGDTIVVGGPFDDGGALNAGALWVFERQGIWAMTQKLIAPNPTSGEAWGWSVAISGNRLAGGAVQGVGLGPGCVRIWEKNAGTWGFSAELVPADGLGGDWFGVDVSMAAGEMVIGAPYVGTTGAVYIYELTGTTWTPRPRKVPGGVAVNWFGATVALAGDEFVVGDVIAGLFPFVLGNAVRYERNPTGVWLQSGTLRPASASVNDQWGAALDYDGETIVLGGPRRNLVGAVVTYTPAGPGTTYCIPKTNSQGCTPTISSAGQASMSDPQPFTLDASNVISQRAGLVFFGINGPAAAPFQGGTLCVFPPLRRAPLVWSGGNQPPDCSGSFTFDFNAYVQAGNEPQLQAGMAIHAQYWYRDPGHADGTGIGLTNAVSFRACP